MSVTATNAVCLIPFGPRDPCCRNRRPACPKLRGSRGRSGALAAAWPRLRQPGDPESGQRLPPRSHGPDTRRWLLAQRAYVPGSGPRPELERGKRAAEPTLSSTMAPLSRGHPPRDPHTPREQLPFVAIRGTSRDDHPHT
ncbi:hypothetical protein HPB51_017401 [Rhipicephalus microplus]|uniref:Uncharacterized protein n=1 Tax=Rhipicephalus microplus TaxID=6941 RepID=A0A9J6DBG6_RHIMP|nr:hypothetical protein HPB51_017401 [Rhipicephalus microplus]